MKTAVNLSIKKTKSGSEVQLLFPRKGSEVARDKGIRFKANNAM
jgi:hypothetical protein